MQEVLHDLQCSGNAAGCKKDGKDYGIEKYRDLSMCHEDWIDYYTVSKTAYSNGTVRYYYFKNEQWFFTEEGKEEMLPSGVFSDSSTFKDSWERKLQKETNEERSIRRSKRVLKDYCLNNMKEGALFVTLTNGHQTRGADSELCYKHNQEFKKRVLKKMNNLRNKYPDFEYILVPEFHESGYIHMHGIFFGFPHSRLIDSGYTTKTSVIYNLGGFEGIGFTTATVIKSIEKASSYITKYITKEMAFYKGWQRYYISRGIKRPEIEKLKMDLQEVQSSVDWLRDMGHGYLGYHNAINDSFIGLVPVSDPVVDDEEYLDIIDYLEKNLGLEVKVVL